jgi:hypothetical protein
LGTKSRERKRRCLRIGLSGSSLLFESQELTFEVSDLAIKVVHVFSSEKGRV